MARSMPAAARCGRTPAPGQRCPVLAPRAAEPPPRAAVGSAAVGWAPRPAWRAPGAPRLPIARREAARAGRGRAEPVPPRPSASRPKALSFGGFRPGPRCRPRGGSLLSSSWSSSNHGPPGSASSTGQGWTSTGSVISTDRRPSPPLPPPIPDPFSRRGWRQDSRPPPGHVLTMTAVVVLTAARARSLVPLMATWSLCP